MARAVFKRHGHGFYSTEVRRLTMSVIFMVDKGSVFFQKIESILMLDSSRHLRDGVARAPV